MDRRRFLKQTALYSGALAGFCPLASSPRCLGLQATAWAGPRSEVDLGAAVVVTPDTLSRRERKAVQVLIEEVEKRTEIRWPLAERLPGTMRPAIIVGSRQALGPFRVELASPHVSITGQPVSAEGYRLLTIRRGGSTVVWVEGEGERGVLFGVGGLLRSLHMSKGQVRLYGQLEIETSPKYRLRGHQLGYRPKTNAYDAWNVSMWEQYYRDLAVFGANAVELIPPQSDDEPDSPHFSLSPMQMMVEMARLADEYGLDVWIWYPAMDKDYANPATVDSALRQWGKVFQALPRIDAVFVPGGDPGHTEPKHLMALLEKQTQNLRHYHPRAQMWTSPQGFDEAWMKEFFELLDQQPAWLSGVVYGPMMRFDVSALRQRLPKRYPIRLYPDITHSLECEFPVPDWDLAYALTEGREAINPRPVDYANIFRLQAPHAIGFISYSEGCNDDVNKMVWSSLAWDPDKPLLEVLREYSGYFISERLRDGFAHGILSLEENWRGPLLVRTSVDTTLEQFRDMETTATPDELHNWRFQMGLYRAYYDAFVRRRLIAETEAEQRCCEVLDEIRRMGARPNLLDVGGRQSAPTSGLDLYALLDEADRLLNEPLAHPAAQDLRTRILELGEALFQTIHLQLAVERYQAEAVTRAANLDTLDAPLTSAPWLRQQLAEIRKLSSYDAQYQAILQVLDRTDPGPGGFYDDLGNPSCQPHLVHGPGPTRDPEFRQTPLVGHGYPGWGRMPVPVAWKRWAESMFDAPLEMQYQGLDPSRQYKLRVVYSGDRPDVRIRLDANGNFPVHPLLQKPWPPKPLEFDVAHEATRGGTLTLIWHRESGLSGNGRGCQVAEVWLIPK